MSLRRAAAAVLFADSDDGSVRTSQGSSQTDVAPSQLPPRERSARGGRDAGGGRDADDAADDATDDAADDAIDPEEQEHPVLAERAIKKAKNNVLRDWCTERGLESNGNKIHLQHRLLKFHKYISPDTPAPPGGTVGQRALEKFNAPGHDGYAVNAFIITAGRRGAHCDYQDFKRLCAYTHTFAEQGTVCLEYGPDKNHRHTHAVVKIKFPTGRIGSQAVIALKQHIKVFMRQRDRREYVHVKPVDGEDQDFECAAGYTFKDRKQHGFAYYVHNMTQDHVNLCITTYERHTHGHGAGKLMLTKSNWGKKTYVTMSRRHHTHHTVGAVREFHRRAERRAGHLARRVCARAVSCLGLHR